MFGGEGKPYNNTVREMMKSIANYGAFNPEKYILKHYDFELDFGPEDGKDRFREGLVELEKRVHAVLEAKAARYVV